MVSTLQRDEDQEGVDLNFGGTIKYLDGRREQRLVATLIDNRTGRIRFLDKTYHCLGKWGDQNCEFYTDEIYHAGKRLSIWLRHIWLRGDQSTNVDRGGWASIDEIIQDEGFWMDVHRELLRNGHDHRKETRYAIFYDKDNMRNQPTLDILMFHRTWLVALIIDNELWNWGRNKKRMEFSGARLHPNITDTELTTLLGTLVNPAGVGSAAEAHALPYSGWVRPLAVRCVSGHSNSAVDLELTTIPITDKVMDAVGGAWHITSRYNLLWIARYGLLPGGQRRRRADIHFSAFAPWDSRYRSSFTNRFACEGEKGMVIYVPITTLMEMGARLASNGVILCRSKIPFTAIQAMFELAGTRGMGPRIQSPSLVDEYVCESIDGEDCLRASPKYIKKIAEQYKDDVEIPFAFRNNVSLALQRLQADEPTASQAKELVNYITRAIIESCPKFEGSCRRCPWCMNLVPASVIRCLLRNAQLVSVGRFMDQSSLGKPRSLDSEVVIDVEESTIVDIDVAIEPDLEDPEDENQDAQSEQDLFDANVEAIIDADTPEDTEEVMDEYGEKVDFAEEYLTISNDVAKEPAAICINTEELGKTYDEMLGYIIFQRRDLLDDYLSLSFTEMQQKVNEFMTPFAKRQFFCPAFFDQDTKLPRPPTKEEYITWARDGGRADYQELRNAEMAKKRYNPSESSLLPCENLDICYEVIKIHEMMWNIFLWAYTTMNVNEFLTPFIAVNEDGYRKLRPNQGAGQRSLISSRVRAVLSNALGFKKYRYVSYRNMPKERLVDGVYHICIEGLYEGQQRRDRIDPELMHIAVSTGLQLGTEYQKRFDRIVVRTINGALRDKKMKQDVDRWKDTARTVAFRQDLLQIQNKVGSGETYEAAFPVDIDAMD